MLIDEIYKQLLFDGICHSTEQFSTEYLGKYENYYNILKIRRVVPEIETLFYLYTALTNKAISIKSHKYPYFVRTRNHLINCCNQIQKHIQQQINN